MSWHTAVSVLVQLVLTWCHRDELGLSSVMVHGCRCACCPINLLKQARVRIVVRIARPLCMGVLHPTRLKGRRLLDQRGQVLPSCLSSVSLPLSPTLTILGVLILLVPWLLSLATSQELLLCEPPLRTIKLIMIAIHTSLFHRGTCNSV